MERKENRNSYGEHIDQRNLSKKLLNNLYYFCFLSTEFCHFFRFNYEQITKVIVKIFAYLNRCIYLLLVLITIAYLPLNVAKTKVFSLMYL